MDLFVCLFGFRKQISGVYWPSELQCGRWLAYILTVVLPEKVVDLAYIAQLMGSLNRFPSYQMYV